MHMRPAHRRSLRRLGSAIALALVLTAGAATPRDAEAAPARFRAATTSTVASAPRLVVDETFSTLDEGAWRRYGFPWGDLNGGTTGSTTYAGAERQWFLPAQVVTGGSGLQLRAERIPTAGWNQQHQQVTYPWRSGAVTSVNTWRYGSVEVEATWNVPAGTGRGFWPKIWLSPSDLSWPPEIDLVEILGQDPSTSWVSHHWGTPRKHLKRNVPVTLVPGTHTYRVDWAADRLRLSVDGVTVISETDPAKIPQVPLYLIMELAVGGTWPGDPDAATQSPATFSISRLRVWQ